MKLSFGGKAARALDVSQTSGPGLAAKVAPLPLRSATPEGGAARARRPRGCESARPRQQSPFHGSRGRLPCPTAAATWPPTGAASLVRFARRAFRTGSSRGSSAVRRSMIGRELSRNRGSEGTGPFGARDGDRAAPRPVSAAWKATHDLDPGNQPVAPPHRPQIQVGQVQPQDALPFLPAVQRDQHDRCQIGQPRRRQRRQRLPDESLYENRRELPDLPVRTPCLFHASRAIPEDAQHDIPPVRSPAREQRRQHPLAPAA